MSELDALGIRDRLGDYKVLGKLGQGSSSVVFEGLQSGEGFSRKVAIKVLLDTSAAHLPQTETRILAQLDHPRIARLLDAGCTASGLRFLVMEMVQGVPCTRFVREGNLGERERLELFLKICEAVQHANRALVVHCDLKPANILVTPDGNVKLLDFGIARLLSETGGSDRPPRYTAGYASPEQMQGQRLTLATDVFSLGALLCELMVGKPARELSAKAPSDLAAIAARALRADPKERYASAGDLAADVERYLLGQPVDARPSSFGYRARKFVARHWRAAVAVALVAIAIVAGAGIALLQQRLAEERFFQIRALANSMLFDVHDQIAKLPGALEPRHLLVRRAVQYLDTLGKSAPEDDDVQLEVARGLLRLADIEGVGNEPSLGQSGQAVSRVDQAEQIARTVTARSPRSLAARRVLYQALEAAAISAALRAGEDSVATGEELVKLAERNAAAAPGNAEIEDELAHALAVRANSYATSKTHSELAVKEWTATVAVWKRLLEKDPGSRVRRRELARSYQYLGGALVRAGEREQGREQALIAYRLHKELEKVPGESVQHMIATDVGLIAVVSAQLGRFAEAIPMFEEQLRIREAVAARDPGNLNALMGVGSSLNRIGTAHMRLKQPDKALPFLERSLEVQRRVYRQDPSNVLSSREMLYVLADLAEAHGTLGARPAMCRAASEAASIMKGVMAKTRETATDAAKKKRVRASLADCGMRE